MVDLTALSWEVGPAVAPPVSFFVGQAAASVLAGGPAQFTFTAAKPTSLTVLQCVAVNHIKQRYAVLSDSNNGARCEPEFSSRLTKNCMQGAHIRCLQCSVFGSQLWTTVDVYSYLSFGGVFWQAPEVKRIQCGNYEVYSKCWVYLKPKKKRNLWSFWGNTCKNWYCDSCERMTIGAFTTF